ncbi:MAG: M23 family metallopeptidase, partial [Acidimicrobiales bacterium]|nr:M23 family metallopeptidase [Acidimicrobiales bacterium]
AMILTVLQQDQPDWFPGAVTPISTPVPGVAIGSGYGMRHHPILGIDRLHAGVDLGGATGTEIHAAADGIVVVAEVRGGYGNTVVIDHGNSLATVYGHNSQLLVKVGDEVHYGDVIALMGSTGLSTGPHCHFETRVHGLPIDPTSVISDFGQDVDYDEGD